MKLTVYDNAQAFFEKVEPFLLQNEAANCVPIGLSTVIVRTPEVYPDPYLALVEDAGEVVAVCVYTPPYRLLLSHTYHPEALNLFVDDLAARYGTLNGVLGMVDLARQFAELWQTKTAQTYRISIKERVFQLETVNPAAGVPGTMRRVTVEDRDLLIRWFHDFAVEALNEDDRAQAERIVDRGISAAPSDRGIYLWIHDNQPVSLAGYTGPTRNGMRIGPVYTPPEFRGHGYASACVAHMSQMLLDEGRKYCFLFTDLSNPTSNHIYQVIGYEPVCDVDMYQFDPLATG